MRILIVTSSYLPLVGGLQTAAHALAVQFQEAGHTVQVITQRHPRSLPVEEEIDGIPIQRLFFLRPENVHLNNRRLDLFLAGLIFAPLTQRKLREILRDFQPDVVNVHYPDEQSPFIFNEHKGSGFKLIVSLHGNEILRWFEQPRPPAASAQRLGTLKKLLLRADGITACSQYLLDRTTSLEIEIDNRSFVIHNGVDLTRFDDRSKYDNPRPYLFGFGRLTRVKGFDILVQAFIDIAGSYPNMDLILAGEGEQKEQLSKIAKSANMEKRIIFWGRASPEQVVKLLNGCMFAVVPSREETFGITALEALAAGKPLLATAVGGIIEFVPREGNLLVNPDVESLTKGLQQMIRLQDLEEIGRKNRQAAANYTWSSVSQKYLEVFAEVIR